MRSKALPTRGRSVGPPPATDEADCGRRCKQDSRTRAAKDPLNRFICGLIHCSPGEDSMRKTLLGFVALTLALGATGAAATSTAPVGLPAPIVDFTPDKIRMESYPSTDFSDVEPVEGSTDWRVVHGTGNAAELWLTVSPEGRLYDMGGRYINYSDDEGETWKSVRPLEPLVNGEGSVVMAPNGDVLGVTWGPVRRRPRLDVQVRGRRG
jgi:hypothetical protein